MGVEVVRMLEPVRANPFALRYHALMSGPNQTPDNTFLAWEHVMRAPEPDDGSRVAHARHPEAHRVIASLAASVAAAAAAAAAAAMIAKQWLHGNDG